MSELRLAVKAPGQPEIFRSIQGEGRNMGRLRAFIRLSGCNLRCVWCDTAYTWNWMGTPYPHDSDREGAPHKFSPASEMVKMPIAAAVEALAALPCEGVVITGGEPLMQLAAVSELAALIKVREPGRLVEIETNGTFAPTETLARHVDLFTVSPKLSHSGNHPEAALDLGALAAYAGLSSAVFKFVAKSPADIRDVEAFAQRFDVARARIYIMPEARDVRTLEARTSELVEHILRAGFHYSDRLHIRLFGARRGV